MGFSIPGYLVALLAHGFLIWAVGNDLVRLLTGVAGDVMNNVPLALVPFGFGLAAAAIIWFLLRRRLNNAFTLVAICLVGFWAWWVLFGSGVGSEGYGQSGGGGIDGRPDWSHRGNYYRRRVGVANAPTHAGLAASVGG